MTRRIWLPLAALVVAAIQIVVLGSMVFGRAAILRDGREITLEVKPVDPRDLLRGDYVRLGYNISSVPASVFEAEPQPQGSTPWSVYVRLRRDEQGLWQPVAARFGRPPVAPARPEDVDIRGSAWAFPSEVTQFISVDYGIERFYLPEGEGKPIEQGLGERPFRMKIAVGEGGTAQIKAFYDGDELIYTEPVY